MFALIVMMLLFIGVGAFGFWVYALIDIVTDAYKNDTDKIIWFLLVFFLPFLGTILYFFVGKDKVSLREEDYV